MQLSWPADERPVWRVRSRYMKLEMAERSEHLDAAVELDEALRMSGKVLQPW